MFVLPQKERSARDIPVKMTVFLEFPATADLRPAKVETRTVDPPAPPVVLYAKCNMKIEVEASGRYVIPRAIANSGVVGSDGWEGRTWKIFR